MLRAEVEPQPDYVQTSALAMQAFNSPWVIFEPEHLKWFCEDAFSRGSKVIALRNGEEKVGQIAMVRQNLRQNGADYTAAQLCDLFILKPFRSKASLKLLYDEVERQFIAEGIRFGLGMPNAAATGVNEFFFRLKPFLRLAIRVGLAVPNPFGRSIESIDFIPAEAQRMKAFVSPFATPTNENGLPWDADSLYRRLCGKKYAYALHRSDDLLAISSSRVSRGLRYSLLAAFVARPGARPGAAEIRAVCAAAAQRWGSPLFAYAGENRTLASLPGVRLPERLRPSPMMLQLRDFQPELGTAVFDRFQLIDFDFA